MQEFAETLFIVVVNERKKRLLVIHQMFDNEHAACGNGKNSNNPPSQLHVFLFCNIDSFLEKIFCKECASNYQGNTARQIKVDCARYTPLFLFNLQVLGNRFTQVSYKSEELSQCFT